ncbi:hypothetical protein D9M68_879210 [compost metagenome]
MLAVEAADHIERVIADIETATRLPVYAFPKEREFFVELKLPLFEGDAHGPR